MKKIEIILTQNNENDKFIDLIINNFENNVTSNEETTFIYLFPKIVELCKSVSEHKTKIGIENSKNKNLRNKNLKIQNSKNENIENRKEDNKNE